MTKAELLEYRKELQEQMELEAVSERKGFSFKTALALLADVIDYALIHFYKDGSPITKLGFFKRFGVGLFFFSLFLKFLVGKAKLK